MVLRTGPPSATAPRRRGRGGGGRRLLACGALAAAAAAASAGGRAAFAAAGPSPRAWPAPRGVGRVGAAAGRTPRPSSAPSAVDAAAGDEGDFVAELPRRLALGGAALLLGGYAVKRFGVDGNMSEFDLAPGSMKGKTVVITGGNTGLGRESAIRLARGGATVVITARTDAKGQEATNAIRQASGSSDIYYQKLDLADLSSIKSFVDEYQKQPYGDRVDILMNNAGVMAIPQRLETKDGFEEQFGVNHLGHFALTGLLLPLLRKAKDFARVVALSSTAHLGATKELLEGDLMAPDRYTQWGAYCQSKLANVLFAKELDRRFKASGVKATAVSCHPGGVDTDLARWLVVNKDDPAAAKKLRDENFLARNLAAFLTRNVQLGANTQIYLAAGADGGYDKSGGGYFDNMAPGLLNPTANDAALARSLWEESERLTGVKIEL